MYRIIATLLLATFGLAAARADDNSAQVFAAVPAWPQQVTEAACDSLSAQASSLSARAGEAGGTDQQQVEQAGQASAADVQSRYGAQAEQTRQSAMDTAQRMQALAQKYQGNQQAMLADPEFQQLMQQAQGANRQVVAMSQRAQATSQPLRDTMSQGLQKQQQFCDMLDAQAQALQDRGKTQAQAARAPITVKLKAEIKGSCKMIAGESGDFPEDGCVVAIGRKHQAELNAAAAGVLQSLAPDYARLRQGAQQCGAALDGVFGHSAEKYTRAAQLLQTQAAVCVTTQQLYDVHSYLYAN